MKTVARSRKRMRHRPSISQALERYQFERYFAPMWEGVKTVEELRARYRKFVGWARKRYTETPEQREKREVAELEAAYHAEDSRTEKMK